MNDSRDGIRAAGYLAAVPVVIALAVSAAFGAADQYLGSLYSPFLTAVSGMSAPWLLLPFVVGACQPSRRRAVLLGLAATWFAVGGYVLMIVSPVEGAHRLSPAPARSAIIRLFLRFPRTGHTRRPCLIRGRFPRARHWGQWCGCGCWGQSMS